MYILGKNNKLWYYEGLWYFITFVREILGIIDNRTLAYISDDKKFAGKTQVIYFNLKRTRHFKELPLNIDMSGKEMVLDINTPYKFLCFKKDFTYFTDTGLGHIKTNIDPNKYIVIYGRCSLTSDHHIFGEYSGSKYYRCDIYYIERQLYYQGEIIVYCDNYGYTKSNFNFKMNYTFELRGTTKKIIKLDENFRYYHESREFITNDEHYISLLNEEIYEKIYTNLFATIAYKCGKYYVGESELILDPKLILE